MCPYIYACMHILYNIYNVFCTGLDGERIFLDRGACQPNYTITEDCIMPPKDECSRVCQPRALEKKTIHSRIRLPQVETLIRSCYAPLHNCLDCERKPDYVFMFTGSKYQKRVDVGKCAGKCKSAGKTIMCNAQIAQYIIAI